ncbi:MAG: polysaccharide deacetylase family protein [Oscillospiraceae bacterium]|nr:polysaccharide deacetylase family protein [Oscillospiraceae bacterium]
MSIFNGISNRIIFLLLAICVIFTMVAPAYAANGTKPTYTVAVRRDTTVRINGHVHHFYTFELFGANHIRIRDLASLLSDTPIQFSVAWDTDRRAVALRSSAPYVSIGGELSPLALNVITGTFSSTRILIDERVMTLPTLNIGGETFFKLRDIADALEFDISWTSQSISISLGVSNRQVNYTVAHAQSSGSHIRILDPNRPVIALTFDDGPIPNTHLILDVLDRHDASATFFVLGRLIASNSATLRRTHEAGHEIAGHAWSHQSLTRMSQARIIEEVENTNNAIATVTGVNPTLFRAPYGATNTRVEGVLEDMGLPIINWSLDTRDWETRSPDATFNIIMDTVRDRDIVLMHDIHEPTALAVQRVVPALIARGFQLVTVSELMCYSNITLKPGVTYRHGR